MGPILKRFFLDLSFPLLIFSVLIVKPCVAVDRKPTIKDPESPGDYVFRYKTLAPDPGPPGRLIAADAPNDAGGTIIVSWGKAPGDNGIFDTVKGYIVYRSEAPDTGFSMLTRLPAGSGSYSDASPENGRSYYYRVASIYADDTLMAAETAGAIPRTQFFHTRRILVLLFMLFFSGAAIFLISHSKKGGDLYIRPIAGIDAVDEAIGRATEMGRPILFVPGLGEASRVATIAAFTILGRVARKVAEYQTRIIVPNYDPVVMTICQEVVKEAYAAAGRPEAFDVKDVYFVTQDQFPYTASVNGTMLRERPATNFYMGMFYAESLILAETGFVAGSIQIAGTDQLIQIPFFIASCDYTLMGEELYAASAYLSREPQQLGTLKAQDWGKVAAILLTGAGIIAYLFSRGAGDALKAWVIGG